MVPPGDGRPSEEKTSLKSSGIQPSFSKGHLTGEAAAALFPPWLKLFCTMGTKDQPPLKWGLKHHSSETNEDDSADQRTGERGSLSSLPLDEKAK